HRAAGPPAAGPDHHREHASHHPASVFSSPGLVAALAASAAVRGTHQPPRSIVLGWSSAWESLMMGVPGGTPSRTGTRPSLSSERSTTRRVRRTEEERRPVQQRRTEEERWTTGQRYASAGPRGVLGARRARWGCRRQATVGLRGCGAARSPPWPV